MLIKTDIWETDIWSIFEANEQKLVIDKIRVSVGRKLSFLTNQPKGIKMSDSVVILGGKRSAIGKFGGALAGTSPASLGSLVTKAALKSVGVSPSHVDHSVAFSDFTLVNTHVRELAISAVFKFEDVTNEIFTSI